MTFLGIVSGARAQTSWRLDFEGWTDGTFDSNFVQMADCGDKSDLRRTSYRRNLVEDPDGKSGTVLRTDFDVSETNRNAEQYGMFILSYRGTQHLSWPTGTFDGVHNDFRAYFDYRQSSFESSRAKACSVATCVSKKAHTDPDGYGSILAVLHSNYDGNHPGEWGGFAIQAESDSHKGRLDGAKVDIKVTPEPLPVAPFESVNHWYRCRMDVRFSEPNEFSVKMLTWDRNDDGSSESSPLATVDFANPLKASDLENRLGDRMGLGLFVDVSGNYQPEDFSVWYDNIVFTTLGAIEMLPVPGGTFTMGPREDERAESDEFPRHDVTLSPYYIGKYGVTNGQYSEVLNWTLEHGYLGSSGGGPYNGGVVFANGKELLKLTSSRCQIVYSMGEFGWKTRNGYSMENHPVVEVTWYGSVAFCNWLSEMEGRAKAYDLSTWAFVPDWLSVDGYRLPTEAEWERAAAWDDGKHWKYGFTGDLIDISRANIYDGGAANPFGLRTQPYTSPVGWYNGENVCPNGNIQTVDSRSAVGAYDMSGNVWEWCQDWFESYGSEPQTNPTGPSTGSVRVLRGGACRAEARRCRSAFRHDGKPSSEYRHIGFSVAASQ